MPKTNIIHWLHVTIEQSPPTFYGVATITKYGNPCLKSNIPGIPEGDCPKILARCFDASILGEAGLMVKLINSQEAVCVFSITQQLPEATLSCGTLMFLPADPSVNGNLFCSLFITPKKSGEKGQETKSLCDSHHPQCGLNPDENHGRMTEICWP